MRRSSSVDTSHITTTTPNDGIGLLEVSGGGGSSTSGGGGGGSGWRRRRRRRGGLWLLE